MTGLGFPPYKELFDYLVTKQVNFFVCGLCARARGVTENDLKGKNAVMATPTDGIKMAAEADRVLTF